MASTYTDEQIELGLIALAYANGNSGQASRELKAGGVSIPRRTLGNWKKKTHLERYERVRNEVLPKIRERAAEMHMGLVEASMEAEAKMIARLNNEAAEVPIRDVAGAARNLATSSGIHTDKAQLLAGEPTQRVQRDITEVLRSLKAMGVTIEGTAEEDDVPQAQLAEATDPN